MWFCFISIKLKNFTNFKDRFSFKCFLLYSSKFENIYVKRLFSSKVSLINIIHSGALVYFSKTN
jgi:hypothetical protein